MRNNYTLQLAPATYSVAAGALLLATISVAVALAKVEAMDSKDIGVKASTMGVGMYMGSGMSSTIRANVGTAMAFDSHRYLSDSSESFVAQLSVGIQPLGADFAEVLEDNFWDLVLG